MKKNYIFISMVLLFCGAWLAKAGNHNVQPRDDENGQWSVVAVYPVNSHASGLAWDGQYIYIGSYGGNVGEHIYRFDPATGTNELFITGPHDDAYGLTWDGEYLWSIDRTTASAPAFAFKLSNTGDILEQFDLPNTYMSGIAYDDGDFWVNTYYPDPGTIHHLSQNGDVWEEVSSFVPPTDQPWDIAIQDNTLWIAEYNSSQLHHVNPDGSLIATYPGSDQRTSGVVFDGTYLWYVTRTATNESFLYKVNLSGAGTPVISVPEAHDYENVTVGNTATWSMTVANTGDGELVLDDMVFPENVPFATDQTFPVAVPADGEIIIDVVFSPVETGIYETVVEIQSNDPNTPNTNITLNGIGLASGPFLETVQEIDYGIVRLNSSNKQYLHLANMGDADLVISAIDVEDDHYWLGHMVSFPITLEPVDSVKVPIWFQPSVAGEVTSEAAVSVNSDQAVVVVNLTGISEELDMPIGDLVWDYQIQESSSQAKAIMAIPDVNNDGFQDVIVSSRDNIIRAFNGNASGDADVLWQKELGTAEYPKALALGSDADEDGIPDIIVGTAWGDRAVTALSSATGEIIWRFETSAMYGDGGWVYMVDVKYDFNGNGFLDVLAATGDDNLGNGPKRIFLLNGQNGEVIWDTPLNAAGYAVLAVEDFNNDGIPDVVAGATSVGQQGRVLGINGINGAILWEYTTAGTAVWALEQISDITEDGIPDIIAGSFNGVYYLMDATDGTMEYSGSLGNALILDFWAAGDLNNDGFSDIVPAYSSVHTAVAISGLDGQILWNTPIEDQSWNIAVLRDMTGDGTNEIAVGTLFNNNFVYFLDGADGDILKEMPMPDAVDALGAIPDVVGNGTMEVVAGLRNGYIGVYTGGPSGDPILYNVTFQVTDENGAPVDGATISVPSDEIVLETDADGMAMADMFAGTYAFTVSKNGYTTVSDFFVVVDSDIQVDVELVSSEPVYNVIFNVTSDEETPVPLENVAIVITPGDITLNTDANGLVTAVLNPGNYDFIATREGYYDYTGDFVVVDENIALNIEMSPDGTYADLINPYLAEAFCYPNPFSDHTRIVFSLVQDSPVSFTFYDSNGRVVHRINNLTFQAGVNEYRWNGRSSDGSLLGEGVYFYEISINNTVYRNRLLILDR